MKLNQLTEVSIPCHADVSGRRRPAAAIGRRGKKCILVTYKIQDGTPRTRWVHVDRLNGITTDQVMQLAQYVTRRCPGGDVGEFTPLTQEQLDLLWLNKKLETAKASPELLEARRQQNVNKSLRQIAQDACPCGFPHTSGSEVREGGKRVIVRASRVIYVRKEEAK